MTIFLLMASQKLPASIIAEDAWENIKKSSDKLMDKTEELADKVKEELPETMKIKKRGFISILPNTIAYKPITYHHLSFGSSYADENDYEKYYKGESGRFSYGRGIGINKIYKPDVYWTWLLKWASSAAYIDVKKPDNFKFFHAFIGGSLIWNFSDLIGSIAIKVGLGPMYVNGTVHDKKEKKWTIAPGINFSYYNFVYKDFFILLKWKLIPIIGKSIYKTEAPNNGFHYLEAINVVSLNLGYYVF